MKKKNKGCQEALDTRLPVCCFGSVRNSLFLINSWGINRRGKPLPGAEESRHFLHYCFYMVISRGFPGGSDSKASAWNAGDPGLIPGLGRSPGEGNGNPLQHSCLENPMDEGAWSQRVGYDWATSYYGDKYPLSSCEPNSKSDCLQLSL